MKPLLLAFGNCQAFAASLIAKDLPSIADQYDVRYLPSHSNLGNTEVEPGIVSRCQVVWEQIGVSQQLPFRNALAAGTRSIRFPELSFPLLWPLNCNDPRNQPDPPNHWGRFPYGDRLALQLLEQNICGAAGYEAWVDRGRHAMPDLRRLFDLEMARNRRRAMDVDVEPMGVILDRWQTERLFATLNHPSNAILWSMTLQLIEASLPSLVIPQKDLDAAKQRFLQPLPGNVDMDWFQVVVHPVVAEEFGLTWCDEGLLHRCEVPGVDHRLTRREFMADYYMAPAPL